jgi:hypothetical protein
MRELLQIEHRKDLPDSDNAGSWKELGVDFAPEPPWLPRAKSGEASSFLWSVSVLAVCGAPRKWRIVSPAMITFSTREQSAANYVVFIGLIEMHAPVSGF